MDARFQNSLTEGEFWTLRSGCYPVYRGLNHAKYIDHNQIIACPEDQGCFVLPKTLLHEPGRCYFYLVQRVGSSGKGEWGTEAVVVISLDEQGELKPDRPNYVCGLNARQLDNGCVSLNWWYWPSGQKTVCDHFLVFSDQGTGSVDYENPIAQIGYNGRYFFNYLSDPIAYSQTWRFCIRSINSEGIDDGSKSVISIQVRLMLPDSVDGVVQLTSF